MPIYEYTCTSCGDEFDAIQSFSERPLKKCKKCGGRLEKKISECSFHLKGSGWYTSDYGRKDRTNEKKSYDEKHKPKDEKGTAPAPKTETKKEQPATT